MKRCYDDDLAMVQHMRGYTETLKMAAAAGQITKPALGRHSRTEDVTLAFWAGVFLGFITGGLFVSLLVEWWLR